MTTHAVDLLDFAAGIFFFVVAAYGDREPLGSGHLGNRNRCDDAVPKLQEWYRPFLTSHQV